MILGYDTIGLLFKCHQPEADYFSYDTTALLHSHKNITVIDWFCH